ncbi:MAG: glycosyltransferase [Caldilineaceae bacterium]
MTLISDCITWLYLLDRLLRLVAIWHFLRRPDPPPPVEWPTIALIQPITTGAANLAGNLQARFAQVYPSRVQHLLVCDAGDPASQTICQQALAAYPTVEAQLVLVQSRFTQHGMSAIASKIEKLNAGLHEANGAIYCFIDDDIEPPPDALRRFVCHLNQPGVGAVFGLPCAASWANAWSTLMTLFVNSNALPTYVPLTYLSDPVAITGHIFALRARDLQLVDGWTGMEQMINDDSDLGRKLIAAQLRLVQTPVIYRVHNEFTTWSAYAAQIKRWFVFPRQAILPYLSPIQKSLSSLLSIGVVLPVFALLLALLTPTWHTVINLLAVSLVFGGTLAANSLFLHEATPFKAWLLTPVTLFVTPLQMLWALLLAAPVIQWRGQTLHIARGGEFRKL